MSQSPAAAEAEVVASAPAPLVKFTAASRFAALSPTVVNLPPRPKMEPYVMWLNQRTNARTQDEITAALGAVALGTPILVDNGEYRRLDVGCTTLLLGEYRFFAKYDFDAEGAPLVAALPEEPEGNNQTDGYKEAYLVLCLHCFTDPNIRPVVSVSRMLSAQCAWVSQIISGILKAATPEWLAGEAKRDPDLGAALASIDPRFRVCATLAGAQKKKYAQTLARVCGHTRETWRDLSRALIEDPQNPDDANAAIDAGRTSLDERIADVEAVIEETQYRATNPRGKRK